jgi:hypothetical protein
MNQIKAIAYVSYFSDAERENSSVVLVVVVPHAVSTFH